MQPIKNDVKARIENIFKFENPYTLRIKRSLFSLILIINHILERNIIKGSNFIIRLGTNKLVKSNGLKISIGLFTAVLVYYGNNFFYVLGNSEKISLINSIWAPLFFLGLINVIFLRKINEK